VVDDRNPFVGMSCASGLTTQCQLTFLGKEEQMSGYVTTYRDRGKSQRIYVFSVNADRQLRVKRWTGDTVVEMG
jgi:hypothetical protein